MSTGAYIMAYMAVLLTGALVVSWDNYGFQESFAASLTCISNVGPGLGILGPMENFFHPVAAEQAGAVAGDAHRPSGTDAHAGPDDPRRVEETAELEKNGSAAPVFRDKQWHDEEITQMAGKVPNTVILRSDKCNR